VSGSVNRKFSVLRLKHVGPNTKKVNLKASIDTVHTAVADSGCEYDHQKFRLTPVVRPVLQSQEAMY